MTALGARTRRGPAGPGRDNVGNVRTGETEAMPL
jgi:hypothetical protein